MRSRILFLLFVSLLLSFSLVLRAVGEEGGYVKLRMSYHIGSIKEDDVFKLNGINESVDELNLTVFKSESELDHAYVCTYDRNNGVMVSLIHSGSKQSFHSLNFTTNASLSDYSIEMKQEIGSSFIIVFSNGACELERKIDSIESYGLPSTSFQMFPYTLTNFPIFIELSNEKIKLSGSEKFGKGTHKICIENLGLSPENKPIIKVRKC